VPAESVRSGRRPRPKPRCSAGRAAMCGGTSHSGNSAVESRLSARGDCLRVLTWADDGGRRARSESRTVALCSEVAPATLLTARILHEAKEPAPVAHMRRRSAWRTCAVSRLALRTGVPKWPRANWMGVTPGDPGSRVRGQFKSVSHRAPSGCHQQQGLHVERRLSDPHVASVMDDPNAVGQPCNLFRILRSDDDGST